MIKMRCFTEHDFLAECLGKVHIIDCVVMITIVVPSSAFYSFSSIFLGENKYNSYIFRKLSCIQVPFRETCKVLELSVHGCNIEMVYNSRCFRQAIKVSPTVIQAMLFNGY